MRNIRRLLIIFFILILSFSFASCKKNEELPSNEEKEKNITIYTINDFHGAIKEKASRMGKVLIDNKNANEDSTFIISAGDMFQGTALSNIHYGKDMIELMNIMKFDAMTVGNHEFDWGLHTVLDYFDGDLTNGEANFSLLGCNVIDKTTNRLPTNMKEYTIIERGDLKVAIIGYIGLGLENSIANEMVKNYEFLDPVPIIKKLASTLRNEKKADIVIASGHDGSYATNREIANLAGNERVDAIINGHNHSKTSGVIKRTADGVNVPYVQAGSSGEYLGKIELTYNPKLQKITSSRVSNQIISSSNKENDAIKAYVDKLIVDTADVFERVIGVAGRDLNQFTGAKWAVNAMYQYVIQNYEKCDIAFTNIGGIRGSAFPINIGETITVDRIYQMMPFDNTIKLVTLKGIVVKNLVLNGGELTYSDLNVNVKGSSVYINDVLIDDESDYRVACIDYIFDKETYPFLKGNDIIATGILFRDVLIENVENATQNNQNCF